MNTLPAPSIDASFIDDRAGDCRCDHHRAVRRAEVLRSVARRYRNRAVLAAPPAASAFRDEAATMEAEAQRVDERTGTPAAGSAAECDPPAA